MYFLLFFFRLGFISQWGALAGRYAALCPPGWPWAAHRMPLHSPNGMCFFVLLLFNQFMLRTKLCMANSVFGIYFIFEANWKIQNI